MQALSSFVSQLASASKQVLCLNHICLSIVKASGTRTSWQHHLPLLQLGTSQRGLALLCRGPADLGLHFCCAATLGGCSPLRSCSDFGSACSEVGMKTLVDKGAQGAP